MVTWVLVEEPTFEVARAFEIVEYRLNSDPEAVQWICAHLPVVEPAGHHMGRHGLAHGQRPRRHDRGDVVGVVDPEVGRHL